MADFSRRHVLYGTAGALGLVAISRDPSAGGLALDAEHPRDQALRPVMGGTWISPAEIEKIGTLGIGVEYNGGPAIITNRHVLDDGSDEEPEDVEGRTVYQPHPDAGAIGEVVDASKVGGAGSSDWAVVAISDSADWSTHTLGFGSVGAPGTPSAGDRVVLDGARTGLLGGEITRVGVDANFRGELYSDMIEYTVDEDRETAGNSGGLVATIDDSGVVHPIGLHTFAVDKYRFAIQWGDLPDAVSVSTAGESPLAPAVGEHVEAAIYDRDGSGMWVWVRNLGDQAASETVALEDPASGDVLDAETLTIDALQDVALALSPGQDRVRLVAGETEIVVEVA